MNFDPAFGMRRVPILARDVVGTSQPSASQAGGGGRC